MQKRNLNCNQSTDTKQQNIYNYKNINANNKFRMINHNHANKETKNIAQIIKNELLEKVCQQNNINLNQLSKIPLGKKLKRK